MEEKTATNWSEEDFFHTEKNFYDFCRVLKRLRADDGCPWDKVQTHDSLRPCMTEEAAEFVSSVRIFNQTGNAENMCEELGDLLLQIVMHAQIAEEEGLFCVDDVIREEYDKMIRRHPHIFGTANADSVDEVLSNWDDIKKKEKENKEWIASPLREIPIELPALVRAPKVLKKLHKLYDEAPTYENTTNNILEIAKTLQGTDLQNNPEQVEKLVGDLLLQISEISRAGKFSSEQILTDRIDDIIEENE